MLIEQVYLRFDRWQTSLARDNCFTYIKQNDFDHGFESKAIALRLLDIWRGHTLTSKQYRRGQGLPESSNINQCQQTFIKAVQFKDKTVTTIDDSMLDELLKQYKLKPFNEYQRKKAKERAKNFKLTKCHVPKR